MYRRKKENLACTLGGWSRNLTTGSHFLRYSNRTPFIRLIFLLLDPPSFYVSNKFFNGSVPFEINILPLYPFFPRNVLPYYRNYFSLEFDLITHIAHLFHHMLHALAMLRPPVHRGPYPFFPLLPSCLHRDAVKQSRKSFTPYMDASRSRDRKGDHHNGTSTIFFTF